MKANKEFDNYNSDNWMSSGNLRCLKNGIDITVVTAKEAFVYESRCFEALTMRLLPNRFGIGPHLTDYILGSHKDWSYEIRPDALIFETDQEDTWKLVSMAEFKSGRIHGVRRKLNGFVSLLDKFREHPNFMVNQIKEVMGNVIKTPEKIIIPENNSIEITLVAPFAQGANAYDYESFPVTYLKVD